MRKSIYKHIRGFTALTICFLILQFIVLSCSYDRGVIISSNGSEKKGYIRFNECYDRYAGGGDSSSAEFKDSKISPWEKISYKDVSRIEKGEEIFVPVDLKKVSGGDSSDAIIPAKLLVSGNISLYRYCSARYMNTMMSSKRMDLNVYILSFNGGTEFYAVPQSPEEFRIFSSEHFSSCPELVREIQNRKFTKKIENPVPGNITEYQLADEKEIIEFTEKYNRCSNSGIK